MKYPEQYYTKLFFTTYQSRTFFICGYHLFVDILRGFRPIHTLALALSKVLFVRFKLPRFRHEVVWVNIP